MDTEAKVKRIVAKGAELTGEAGAGALVGSLFGGPLGAVAGGLSPLLAAAAKKILSEMADRVLTSREEIRIGLAAWHALVTIDQHRAAGRLPREDNFFEEGMDGRSPAEEIFEGVLLKSKAQHEERKARFIGNIFGNAAFGRQSVAAINTVLSIAESLSYRQLCIASIPLRKKQLGLRATLHGSIRSPSWGDEEGVTLLFEVKALRDKLVLSPYDNAAVLKKTQLGITCYELMGLSQIPEDELRELDQLLSESR